MLMSFPGLVDTAAPVTGAAGNVKPGAAVPPDLEGDFASLMQGAEDAQAAPSEPAAAGAPDPTPQGASVTSVTLSAADARPTPDGEGVGNQRSVADLAGFFRSMRTQAPAAEAAIASTTPEQARVAEPPEPSADAVSGGEDPTVVPAIVVVADVSVTPHALPGLGLRNVSGAQEWQDLPAVDGAQVAPDRPVVAGATVHANLSSVDGADVVPVAQSMPGSQDTRTMPDASMTIDVTIAPDAALDPEVTGATDTTIPSDLAGAQGSRPGRYTQQQQDAPGPLGPRETPPAQDVPLMQRSPRLQDTPVARDVVASVGVTPAPVPAAPADSPMPSKTPLLADVARGPLAGLPATVEVALEIAAAAENGSVQFDAATAPVTPVTARAREIAELLHAEAQNASKTPAVLPASPVVFARPPIVSLAVDHAGAPNAPKLKITLGLGDVASPRLDRVTAGARVLSPVYVAPHSTPAPMAAAAAPAAMTVAGLVDAQVTDQIVQTLRMQWAQGGGDATIELNPNALGKVRIQVRVDRGVVSASVQAETPLVREWVASHRDELRENLAQQGLRLDKLVVAETTKEPPTRDGARDPRQGPRESSRQRRGDRDEPTDTFELNDPQETA